MKNLYKILIAIIYLIIFNYCLGKLPDYKPYLILSSNILCLFNTGNNNNSACSGSGGSGGIFVPAIGQLDTSFGSGGIITTPIGTSDDIAYAIALQPDGKILVAGYSYNGSNDDFAVVRYKSDGSLDTSFELDGKVITTIGSSHDRARAIVLQPDGKILVAGYYTNGSYDDFAVVRYKSDGSIDTSFGSGGIKTTSISIFHDSARVIALQPDGKILVSGYTFDNTNKSDFALVRYKSDGSLDTSFGSGGIVTTDIIDTSNYYDEAYALSLQPDDKILVAGYSFKGPTNKYDFSLVRYNTDGSLDTSFGSGGIVTYPTGTSNDGAYAMALQPDGKILVAGYSDIGSNNDFALVRYNSNGSLDTTFGSGGIITTPIGTSDDIAYAIALQPDGKILVAGYSYNGSNYDFTLVRYNTDGSLDTTFGSGGIVTTPIGSSHDYASAIAIQPDGKILVAGYFDNGSDYDFVVVRYK